MPAEPARNALRAPEEKLVTRGNSDRDEFRDKCNDFEAGIAKETAASHFTHTETGRKRCGLQEA